MKHAAKEKPAKTPKPGRKKIALIIILPAVAIIAVLVFFNYNYIYGVISPVTSRIFNGARADTQETIDEGDEIEITDNGEIEDTAGQSDEGSLPVSTDDLNEAETISKYTGNESPAADKEKNDEEEKEDDKKEQGTSPSIKLEIYEGPIYSEADDVCYYRVRAIVSGNPQPKISFSKDDSRGWLGQGKAQVNLKRNEGQYTLTATAQNNLGKASGSLNLSWGCNRSPDIRGINISPGTVYAGGQYEISADAIDLDGDSISYAWSATGGSLSSSSSNPARWQAPSSPGDYNITLTASDDKGNKSEPKTLKVTVRAASGPVTNNTSVVGYVDVSQEQLVSLFTRRNSSKTERAARLAPLYIKYGKMFNIRADIAWAQMIHETGLLEYTGDVKPHQNNFGGIGATGGGNPGNSFATEELGIIAQYAHLAWYYFPTHVNQYCTMEYDPRHFENAHIHYTGDTRLGFLNGRWAPGATYTDKIALFASEVFGI